MWKKAWIIKIINPNTDTLKNGKLKFKYVKFTQKIT